ncbi:hypothetical protein BDK51DRAFT_32768 [Blyttiomyces helicus]|uniref:Uncharacterized protein n=1 Tax=Blyttiomyces helicus TaxID=388810 RepID=A0A4P9VY97_9FUNG|nr:hypothetical protein BDK51DRAFT_32768 [Blyttiomyces helicus]|eukprot:RKO84739.1 hypothetical protein BDK51DRAFT_32768 [Blyttiomyces helicus]
MDAAPLLRLTSLIFIISNSLDQASPRPSNRAAAPLPAPTLSRIMNLRTIAREQAARDTAMRAEAGASGSEIAVRGRERAEVRIVIAAADDEVSPVGVEDDGASATDEAQPAPSWMVSLATRVLSSSRLVASPAASFTGNSVEPLISSPNAATSDLNDEDAPFPDPDPDLAELST